MPAQTAQQPPPSAAKYQALSALAASAAAAEATTAWAQGATALASTVVNWQVRSAILAERGVAQMLTEQGIPARPLARLNPAAFTTPPRALQQMAASVEMEWQIERMVASITQEAARAAQEAAIAVQDEDLRYVRMLNLPSCSRCAILAGKTYDWEADFDRHTGCDCTAIPVTEHDTSLVPDPEGLARQGLVTDLSKADLDAINHGADMSRVVNVRRRAAGLSVSGEVLARAGRLTPAGARRAANGDKSTYLSLLEQNGYLLGSNGRAAAA